MPILKRIVAVVVTSALLGSGAAATAPPAAAAPPVPVAAATAADVCEQPICDTVEQALARAQSFTNECTAGSTTAIGSSTDLATVCAQLGSAAVGVIGDLANCLGVPLTISGVPVPVAAQSPDVYAVCVDTLQATDQALAKANHAVQECLAGARDDCKLAFDLVSSVVSALVACATGGNAMLANVDVGELCEDAVETALQVADALTLCLAGVSVDTASLSEGSSLLAFNPRALCEDAVELARDTLQLVVDTATQCLNRTLAACDTALRIVEQSVDAAVKCATDQPPGAVTDPTVYSLCRTAVETSIDLANDLIKTATDCVNGDHATCQTVLNAVFTVITAVETAVNQCTTATTPACATILTLAGDAVEAVTEAASDPGKLVLLLDSSADSALGLALAVHATTDQSGFGSRTLRRGMTGSDVKELQIRVAGWYNNCAAGASCSYHFTLDGSFGPGTERAVKYFQRAYGLTRDGVVGPKTFGALKALEDADKSTKHFDFREFAEKPGQCETSNAGTYRNGQVSEAKARENVRRVMWRMEVVRAKNGDRPMTVNSGFRSTKKQSCLNGQSSNAAPPGTSQHEYGTARDGYISSVTRARERSLAKTSEVHGIQCYQSSTHNHLDIRADNPDRQRGFSWPRKDSQGRDLSASGSVCYGGQGSSPSSGNLALSGEDGLHTDLGTEPDGDVIGLAEYVLPEELWLKQDWENAEDVPGGGCDCFAAIDVS